MKIYIAGAIADTNKEVLDFYEELARKLEEKNFDTYVPHVATSGLPVLDFNDSNIDVFIFETDMRAFVNCDLVLAYIGERSLGVGAELAFAMERGKPVLAYHEHDKVISRFISGMISKCCWSRRFKIDGAHALQTDAILDHIVHEVLNYNATKV